MLLKRHIPLLIVIVVGLITLFGHFIAHEGINNFVKNVSTEWFDIIASFAIFLGALNMMKLHAKKIINKRRNWQYSILAVLGFSFAIFAGFLYRGSYYVSISNVEKGKIPIVSEIIAEEINESNPVFIQNKLISSKNEFKIDKTFITKKTSLLLKDKLNRLVKTH